MKTINGVATSAIIFNTNTNEHSIDDYAIAQIKTYVTIRHFQAAKSVSCCLLPAL